MKKKYLLSALGLVGAAAVLFACETTSPGESPQPSGSLLGTFQGTLPCAKCPGTETTLTLLPGKRYQLKYFQIGQSGVQEETGSYSKFGRRLTLTERKETFLIINRDTLELLDENGRLIASPKNLQLRRMH